MNDDIKNASSGAPPKLILRRPVGGASADTALPPDSPTVRDGRAPTSKRHTTRIDLSAGEVPAGGVKPKKQTSRISLDSATGAPPVSDAPLPGILESAPTDESVLRTIKIKRPANVQAPKLSQPIDLLLHRQAAAPAEADRTLLKKQTSRISLESALTPEETPAQPVAEGVPITPAVPATIRIKRPGKTIAEPAPVSAEPAAPAAPASEQPTLVKNQTSKIEIAPSALPAPEGEGQPTQKKTIKIRRPDGSPAPTVQRTAGRTTMRMNRNAATDLGGVSDLGLTSVSTPEVAPEIPLTRGQKILRLVGNIVFSAVASFAVIVSGIVIYVLTLQKYDW